MAGAAAVPASPAVRLPSAQVTEKYDIDESQVFGTGAFSAVVFGRCKQTGEERAIKVMHKSTLTGKKADMVAHEKEILRRVRCPYIVKLYECIETEDRVFMVLERMDTDLYEWIRHNKKLCEQDASKVARALLTAVNYLHQHNVVHRDIKPENILINDVDTVRLADFGLAKVLSNDMVSATPCGTSFYIAPEIIRGIQMHGVKPLLTTSHDVKFVDMWSIGIVLYIMLAGTPPFVGQIRSRKEREDLLKKIDRGVLFPDARWKNISHDAKDLVEGLLTLDTRRRLTAAQALNHRFITRWEEQSLAPLETPGIFQQAYPTKEAFNAAMDPQRDEQAQYHDKAEAPGGEGSPQLKGGAPTAPVALGGPKIQKKKPAA
eukprot:TRINITY_DN11970_c0_g1_i1.p1 TRINITY_DN11970_c0_g1~~TRINITY_DN11970_c0_g1_i1.p1  ORF type:complete len:375 (+),score=155.39 TRINITY_DN11970_c0_g1_i1:100-1224(+)